MELNRNECPNCGEGFEPGEPSELVPHALLDGSSVMLRWHSECLLRISIGSVAHQEGRCECYGGTGGDHEFASKRHAARAAARAFRRHHPWPHDV